MNPLPLGLGAIVRALLPHEFADDVVTELEERYADRRLTGRISGALWLAREVATTPFLGLRRQAWRLRVRGVRTHEHVTAQLGGWANWKLTAGLMIALRSLRKRPGFATVAILTLVASVGASTLIFSLFEGVLLRPLPYPDADRLHFVYGTNQASEDSENDQALSFDGVTGDMIELWRTSIPEIESVAGSTPRAAPWADGLTPALSASGAFITPGYFETLALEPRLGRFPSDEEFTSGDAVIVIGESLWSSRYGRDVEILGRTVTIGDRAFEIVGVAPAVLRLPREFSDWWAPIGGEWSEAVATGALYEAVVRLREGADVEAVEARMTAAVVRLAETAPAHADLGAHMVPLRDMVVEDGQSELKFFLGAVVLIVLIACVNLAILVLARGSHQRGELAVRAALGASRRDLVWVMLSEVVAICVVGGGLGVILATRALDPFLALLTLQDFPRIDDVGVNATVLAFSLGVTVLTVLLAGLLPGLATSRRAPWEALQNSRRSGRGLATRRTQRTLLFIESVMAIVLLAFGGWLTRTTLQFLTVDSGFDEDAVAYVRIEPSQERYSEEAEILALTDTVGERLAGRPDVSAVAWAQALPGVGHGPVGVVRSKGSAEDSGAAVLMNSVSPGYFNVLGIEVVRGRTFTEDDTEDAQPVVIVSELMARNLFGQEDPIGRIAFVGEGLAFEGTRLVATDEQAVTVVGVVADIRHLSLALDPDALLYLPMRQAPAHDQSLVLRAEGGPEALLDVARAAVLEADPMIHVGGVGVLWGAVHRPLTNWYVATVLFVTFAALACLLTFVGIYGVVAYVVSDQVREIGLRIALGARAAGEESRVVLGALKPVVTGAILGLVGVATFDAVDQDSPGSPPFGVLTYLAVLTLFAGAAAVAAWLPARRAAVVDPARVLSEQG